MGLEAWITRPPGSGKIRGGASVSRSVRRAALTAVLVHGVALGALDAWAPRPSKSPPPPEDEETRVLFLDDEPVNGEAPPPPPAPPEGVRPTAASVGRGPRGRSLPLAAAGEPPAPSGDGIEAEAPSPATSWTFEGAARVAPDLGLDGAARLHGARILEGEGVASLDGRGLAASLVVDDGRRGFGVGGAVAAAAREATWATPSPVRGQATFAVVLEGTGAPRWVRLGDNDGDAPAWSQVAAAMEDLLRRRPPRRPTFGRPVEVRVEVQSRVALPSGHDAEVQVHLNLVPLHKSRGSNPVKLSLLLVPGFVGLGGSFDETDLTFKGTRRVTARVVGEQPL